MVPGVDRFLIIEDSPSMRAFITAVLEGDGVEAVEEAPSAMAGYRAAVAEPPRCVLLDVNLPNVSGLEVLSLLRRHEATRAVPVVMVTTESGAADRARAMALGAHAWVEKPFTPAQLLDAVRPFR
jgi:two-component system chemotaxis response regulator CheY